MLRLQQIILIVCVFFGAVFAKEGLWKIPCKEGMVQMSCNQDCCQANESEIQAGGNTCNETVEKELLKFGEVRCPTPRGCDPGLNVTDIRIMMDSGEKYSRVGETVNFTYNAYSMQSILNSTWTRDGSFLRNTDRIHTRTNSLIDTLHVCDRYMYLKVAHTAVTLSIHDVGIKDAGHISSTVCSPTSCVTTNFTLRVSEPLPPSASTPAWTTATPNVSAADDQERHPSLVPRVLMGALVTVLVVLACLGGKCNRQKDKKSDAVP